MPPPPRSVTQLQVNRCRHRSTGAAPFPSVRLPSHATSRTELEARKGMRTQTTDVAATPATTTTNMRCSTDAPSRCPKGVAASDGDGLCIIGRIQAKRHPSLCIERLQMTRSSCSTIFARRSVVALFDHVLGTDPLIYPH